MPETVRMALSRYCQRETNVTVQEKKQVRKFPLDKGHFITVIMLRQLMKKTEVMVRENVFYICGLNVLLMDFP